MPFLKNGIGFAINGREFNQLKRQGFISIQLIGFQKNNFTGKVNF